jgi:formate-dependent nitrite reductase membrane component NrfD
MTCIWDISRQFTMLDCHFAIYYQPPKNMTVGYFRLLVVVSLIIGIIGGTVDLVFPALMPEPIQQAQELQNSALSMARVFFVGGLAFVLLILLIPCFYGLYMLRPWAPRLSLIVSVLSLVVVVASGTYAQSGLALAMSYLGSNIWGAVLVIALCPPFNAHFKRRDG